MSFQTKVALNSERELVVVVAKVGPKSNKINLFFHTHAKKKKNVRSRVMISGRELNFKFRS